MQHINAEFGFEIVFRNEFTHRTPVGKGQRGVTVATNFGTKIAINIFVCGITKMRLLIQITCNPFKNVNVAFVAQLKQRFHVNVESV